MDREHYDTADRMHIYLRVTKTSHLTQGKSLYIKLPYKSLFGMFQT